MAIVVSALHRLDLYVDVFGATRLRLEAAALCAWIGGLIALTLIAVVSGRWVWLGRGAVALTAAAAIAFTLLDPDALIAARNVERFERTCKIDVAYNSTLSADAAPGLATLPPAMAGRVLAPQRLRLAEPDDLTCFNLAREEAREALS